jgi:catechol 2,3-dioxygenase-like lactoylglutathione lyase family enzyme
MAADAPNYDGAHVSSPIRSISAITLATHDMGRAVAFYEALGFRLRYGGADAFFTSFTVGGGFLNLIRQSPRRTWSWWGRVIFHVDDVDALYFRALSCGMKPESEPADADWGERYFHLVDPDGHELSFARPLDRSANPDSESFNREDAPRASEPADGPSIRSVPTGGRDA